ncbi:MAG: XRE family transcriptional regulator [Chloroflexales bacterium]|nr:XRE family transcriptional regulator [Chloroflexales bacterium]
MSALSNFLREQMRRRGWEQKDLSAEAEIPKATVSRLVNDHVQEPELTTLLKLSQALEVPLGQIMELAGFPVQAAGSPEARQTRLIALSENLPWLTPVIEEIAALSPDERESVLTYLEALRNRRRTK